MKNADMTILYIDDDNDDAEIFREALKWIDPEIKCITTSNGRQAFEKLDPCPDFVFLDYRMPQYSGLDVLKRIAKSSSFSFSRIVMYSSFMSEREIADCSRIGVNNYMRKTEHFHSLVNTIRTLLFPAGQPTA